MSHNNGRIPYSEKEDQFLRRFYAEAPNEVLAKILGRTFRSVSARAFLLKLYKTPEFKMRYILRTAFKPGIVPFNKGTKGFMKANSGTFKKGNIPATNLYDGCIMVRKSKRDRNYLYVRISQGKWIPLQQKNWIDANGPIPKGHIVVFKTKDTFNCDLSNLELISRKENADRNRDSNLPPELRSAIRTLNKLRKIINGQEKSRQC